MKYKVLVVVAILTLVGSSMALSNYLRANIPFNFTADGVNMPAGSYQILRTGEPDVLMLSGPTGSILVGTNGAENPFGASSSKLVFDVYGGHYYLSKVWRAGDSEGFSVPINRKKLSIVAQKGTTVEIAAIN
jgi:hypothetical protein